jgi:hypothetical protein
MCATRALVIAAFLLGPTATAAAETPAELIALFAHTEVSKVTAAHGVRLEGVRDYQQMVVGTYKQGEWDMHVVVLMRCGRTLCHGYRVAVGNAPFELRGLVDLAGKPGALGDGAHVSLRDNWHTRLSGKGLKFPALVVTTRDEKITTGGSRFRGEVRGSERHHKLLVISLRKSEEKMPRVAELSTMDLYPSGAGRTASFTLVRGKQRGALDIREVEQRHIDSDMACIAPDPVEYTWCFKSGRYSKFDDVLGRAGCH